MRWGYIYNDLNESDTALVYLTKAYKRQPHYLGLEFELVYAYNALGNYDGAIRVLSAATEQDPKNVLFYRELGYAYLHKKDYNEAISDYKRELVFAVKNKMIQKAKWRLTWQKLISL